MDAKRDWGFAPEYCEGMWRILQHKKAEDFVLATGETHTIREFAELTFKEIGIELEWTGKDEKEKGIIKRIDFEKAKKLIDYYFIRILKFFKRIKKRRYNNSY